MGSARVSRAGDRVDAVANFLTNPSGRYGVAQEKIVGAGHRNEHARRVRYPQVANALIVIKFLCNLLATCSNEYSSAPCALQSLSQRLLRYSGGSE
ncbi:MAG: hypothetical protein DME78_11895 [Verrucomicrobia bacterium]|nr:MAG: hypothetical protein DME78_11895 [Verrucomicrobiota bacterium]